MVQSYQSPVRVYKYPFELVMEAYIRRFPTCEMIPIVAGCDITEEEISDDKSIEKVSRRCKLHVDAPYILKKLMGVDHVYFIQTNTLDRRNRHLVIDAHNESFVSRVVINEYCKYSVHPENSDWTCFEQTASLDVKSFFGFENTVEKIAMKQYSNNISKGKEIIEYFIEELRKEGITYVPCWIPPEESAVPKVLVTSENGVSSHLTTSIHTVDSKMEKLSTSEEMSKLNDDYIRQYLGDLTPLQESRLVQLRKWVAQLQKGKVPSDTTLLRFLKARDFHLEKAREMLSLSLIWRKRNQVDKILSEYKVPKVIENYFPGGWHHSDKAGHPLYLIRIGQMDVKGLVKSVGEEGLLKHILHICEEGLTLTQEATQKQGKPITTWTLLVDLEGLNMRHLWRPGIRALLKIIEVMENNYPETMSCVLIVRAPRVFPILWTLVSTFIDEHTRSKFLFYGGNDYQGTGGLIDYMDKDIIPDFLGGECTSNIQDGGLVPKTLYLPGEETDCGRQHIQYSDQSIYHSVSLSRGQVHEVVLPIQDVGSVICWDFDIMKSDVSFALLRTKIPIKNEPQSPVSTTGGMADGALGTDEHHKLVIDKSWKEGEDYFSEEPLLICHDGESVQGSHVTSHMGTYVLQWHHYEAVNHSILSSPLDFIDSFTAHKAKIMYYYEILRSTDYKGSMTSLQSCHSGFSSLSSHTSKSVTSSCPSR